MNESAQAAFKTLIGRYSEDTYFYLARNYLGLIQTPFHKPQLTTRMVQFFSQEAVVTSILDLLDSFDQALISLVALAGPLTVEQITRLMKEMYSYGHLLRRISNLQERMILLSDEGRLVFNPLLEEELRKRCSLRPLLGDTERALSDAPYCSTEFIRGYLSLVAKEGKCTYQDQTPSHFPTFEPKRLEQMYLALGSFMTDCGILINQDRKCSINYERAQQLLNLTDHQLICLLIAKDLEGEERLAFANALLQHLQALGGCDTNALKLLIKALCIRYQIGYSSSVLNELSTWGVLSLDEVWKVSRISDTQEQTPLIVDSDQTISYQGTCATDDILYRFAFLEVLDMQKRYRITKESLISALDSSLDFASIQAYLEQHSANKMNSALATQLSMIAEQYQNITIYDGLVLTCDTRTANLVEKLPAMAQHRLVTLAPSIFLMRRDTEEIWRQVLRSAGQLVGATRRFEQVEVIPSEEHPLLLLLIQKASQLEKSDTLGVMAAEPMGKPVLDPTLPLAIEESNLSKAQKEDTLHRYQSRMIVRKSQIAAHILNPVIEAGGFDYQGKVSLCKQASGRNDLVLELQLPEQELVVQALEIAYTPQKEALLKAAIMPTMEVKILPVSKIFLVRLVRFHLA